MKTKQIFFGGIAGGVTFFILGYIIYGVLLMNYTTANYNQGAMRPMTEMIWWAMILANLAFGFILSFVLSWSNTTIVMAGVRLAIILGLLLSLSVDLSNYAMTTMFSNFGAVLVDIVGFSIMSGVSGAVVIWIMGRIKS